MKKSELKELIREELKKALSEEKSVIWKGSRVKVVKDDGGPTLTIIKPDGKVSPVSRKDTYFPSDESSYSLIDNKHIIAMAIENSNIPDEEFEPYTKMGTVNFIQKGNPSESYLEKIMDILKKYDVKVEFPPLTPLSDRSTEDIEDFNAILSKHLK